jgi:hypothetical protein
MVRPNGMFDVLYSVSHIAPMDQPAHRIRKSISRGTPSYQLGHYEMSEEKGKRRSVFKVDVHSDEHVNADEALTAWTNDVRRLQTTRPRKAEKLQRKMVRLRELKEA